MKKKDYKNLLWLIVIGILLVLIVGYNKIYGSSIDWISQHVVFPEYFRLLFYKTHNLFSNFAFNIGSGQNIFNFAYYGLYNPYVLLSYLFPFIKMIDYMQIINILIIFISTMLIYKWLNINKYSSKVCFISSLIFMLASPIIYHSHKHIMFVSYMPFLILSLIGVDKYFKNNKSYLLILGIFLMILTNYYFSVCGLIVIGIYGIFKYLSVNKKFVIRDFISFIFKYVLLMLIGVLLSTFLLLPIVHTLIGPGREKVTLDFLVLLKPNFDVLNILYDPFSIGVSAIGILGLIYGFSTNKRNYVFLSLIISLFVFIPIFMFILNGGLYIRAKALLPFIPLAILLISNFIKNIINREINIKQFICSVIVINIVVMLSGLIVFNKYTLIYLLDLMVSLVLLLIFYNKKSINVYFLFVILVSFISVIIVNSNDKLVSHDKYNTCYNSDNTILIDKALKKDKDFYRFNNYDSMCAINRVYDINYYTNSIYSSTYNQNYDNSVHNDFNNAFTYRNNLMNAPINNIMLNTYMSVKYIVSDKNNFLGYNRTNSSGKYNLYKNDNVFSLGFLNNNTINIKDFNKLSYPYKSEALLNYVIVENSKGTYKSNIIKKTPKYEVINKNIKLTKLNNKYIINSKNNGYLNIKLDDNYKNKVMFISFDLENGQSCNKGDLSININGILNKLTCDEWIYKNNNNTFHYTLNDESNLLNINFSKGKFVISNINIYYLNYDKVIDSVDRVDSLKDIRINDNKLTGKINATKDGYFVFSIPYDEGFKVKVNNKKIRYENVNNGYIGFYLEKGIYDIELEYHAPWFKEGKLISLFGFIIFVVIFIYEKKKY